MGHEKGVGLPTAGELAEQLAQEVTFPGVNKQDLLQVSQYYTMVRDPQSLRESIRKKLTVKGAKPSPVHNTLATLPFRYILTTNFDNLMERSLTEYARKQPNTEIYERRSDANQDKLGTIAEPIVYKLHGSLEKLHTMIVTEDDVIDFSACVMLRMPPLLPSIKAAISDYSILFIGYGLKDWNIRVMLKALRGERKRHLHPIDYAIQRRPVDKKDANIWDISVMYWRHQESLKCFDMDAVHFVGELKRRFDKGDGRV